MKERLGFLIAEAQRFWRIAEATTPAWLRLLLVCGIGAIVAVFFGWVDTHGDAIKVYMTLVGIVVASAASFVGGRVISEHADRRTTKRKLSSARVKILMLEFALEDLAVLIEAEAKKGYPPLGDDATIGSLVGAMQDVAATAAERPNFDQVLERNQDLPFQIAVLGVFRKMTALSTSGDLTAESLPMRIKIATRLCSADGRRIITKHVNTLREARAKLDALAADL
jgi:hypothetical protein